MVDVEQREVVAVDVREPHLGLVRRLARLVRADEALRDWKVQAHTVSNTFHTTQKLLNGFREEYYCLSNCF